MGTSQDNHDHEFRGDFHSEAGSAVTQDLSAFDEDMGQVDRAMGVVDELEGKQELIESMESYNQDTSRMVQASVDALLRVANIGHRTTARPDLQSYTFTSKEADLQSIGETASKVWDSIISAIKKAIEWVVGLFKRIFGIGKNTDDKIEKIEEIVKEQETKKKDPKKAAKAPGTPSGNKNAAKTFQYKWTAAMDMLFESKTLKNNTDSLPQMQRNIVRLKSIYENWESRSVFTPDFFTMPAPSGLLKENGAPNRSKGHVSESISGKVILVYGPPQAPTVYDDHTAEAFVKSVVMKVVAADYIPPNVGKEITVTTGSVYAGAMLEYIKQHRKAIEELESWCEAFVKKCQTKIDQISKSSKKDSATKANLIGLKFLVAGPAVRYVAMWNQALNSVASDLSALLLRDVAHS
jgi:hypothetical protein